jgi:hypothetical protein
MYAADAGTVNDAGIIVVDAALAETLPWMLLMLGLL